MRGVKYLANGAHATKKTVKTFIFLNMSKIIEFLMLIIVCTLINCRTKPEYDGKPEVTNDDLLSCVVNYATVIIEKGLDVYGDEHSPLIASTLNRKTLRVDSLIKQIEIPGIRSSDRSITGSNPIYDKFLYKLLYLLSETSGDRKFEDAANSALKFFFNNCQSPVTGLMAWGEHIFWDFFTDTLGFEENVYHEAEEWPLWNYVYGFAPEAAYNYAMGLWMNQVACHKSGDFSRHAGWLYHNPHKGADYPRYAGQMIEVWADAYNRPENRNRPDRLIFINAIEVVLNRMIKNRSLTVTEFVPAFRGANYIWTDSNLELARCIGEAANNIDNEKLQEQLKYYADKLDHDFLRAPHKLSSGGGFALTLDANSGKAISRSTNKPYTDKWEVGYGYVTQSFIANNCFRRYNSIVDKESFVAKNFRKLILQTGNQYLTSEPDRTLMLKPKAFADAIILMLNCYSLNPDRRYLDRAFDFAGIAIHLFFDQSSDFPKATNQHDHYESLTGAPELMYAMLLIHNIGKEQTGNQ